MCIWEKENKQTIYAPIGEVFSLGDPLTAPDTSSVVIHRLLEGKPSRLHRLLPHGPSLVKSVSWDRRRMLFATHFHGVRS
jgi:hypothetical protein